jgi:hypothetical protein
MMNVSDYPSQTGRLCPIYRTLLELPVHLPALYDDVLIVAGGANFP